jgi:hypothetical protein
LGQRVRLKMRQQTRTLITSNSLPENRKKRGPIQEA